MCSWGKSGNTFSNKTSLIYCVVLRRLKQRSFYLFLETCLCTRIAYLLLADANVLLSYYYYNFCMQRPESFKRLWFLCRDGSRPCRCLWVLLGRDLYSSGYYKLGWSTHILKPMTDMVRAIVCCVWPLMGQSGVFGGMIR